MPRDKSINLPSPAKLRRAIDIYLKHAYERGVPQAVQKLIPPKDFQPHTWLMSEAIERTPPDAPLEAVRSFAMRLGNTMYPNMKLRLSRPPNQRVYVFSVDCHDAFLKSPVGSGDLEALRQLKQHNTKLAAIIVAEFEKAHVPTEHEYLRSKIKQARGGCG